MTALLPGFEVNEVLGPFVAVAVSMVAVTVVVLGLVLARERRPPFVTQMLLTVAVVGGGSVLLLALVFAFLNPNGTDAWTWVLMAFNFMMAVPVGLWFVALVVYRDRRVAGRGWGWPLLLGAATTGSEVLMGILFAVGESNGALSATRSFGDGLSSVWYYWSMAAVMAALIAWARLGPAERTVARGLLLTAVLAPWVTAYPAVGGIAVTVVMAGVVGALMRQILQRRVAPGEARFLLLIALAFVAMTVSGLFLAVGQGSDPSRVLFGTVMGLVMSGEVAYLVRACYAGAPDAASSYEPVGGPAPGEPARG